MQSATQKLVTFQAKCKVKVEESAKPELGIFERAMPAGFDSGVIVFDLAERNRSGRKNLSSRVRASQHWAIIAVRQEAPIPHQNRVSLSALFGKMCSGRERLSGPKGVSENVDSLRMEDILVRGKIPASPRCDHLLLSHVSRSLAC